MKDKRPLAIVVVLLAVIAGMIYYAVRRGSVAVFHPEGPVARGEEHLMIFALSLSLIVVVPVFFMTGYIVWRYRATNTRARYNPDWDHNAVAETIWWLVPITLIGILAVVTWQSTHRLDPSRTLASKNSTMTIQVVAMDWKWLFVYPQQNIATLNYVEMPVGRPVDFMITSDAPMNSFWVPQLGGQIYAMAGMTTHLNLMADEAGTYYGSSANISGTGFSGMHFTAHAVPQETFNSWATHTRLTAMPLTGARYAALSMPSSNLPTASYGPVKPDLFDSILDKYMYTNNLGVTP